MFLIAGLCLNSNVPLETMQFKSNWFQDSCLQDRIEEKQKKNKKKKTNQQNAHIKARGKSVYQQIYFLHCVRHWLLDLRRLVPLGLLLDQLPLGVDSEDPAQRHPHLFIGKCILCGDIMIIMKTWTATYTECPQGRAKQAVLGPGSDEAGSCAVQNLMTVSIKSSWGLYENALFSESCSHINCTLV